MSAPLPSGDDLAIGADNMAAWFTPPRRRHAFHHLHEITLYACRMRAAVPVRLADRRIAAIGALPEVAELTNHPAFSALAVVKGQDCLFEAYAPDFGPDQPHSIQSISKTFLHVLVGQLVADGAIDLQAPIDTYLPLGSGYAGASVQHVLNMDVVNDYSEDFEDPASLYYTHEEALGWRRAASEEAADHRAFLARITSVDTRNPSGFIQYKCANSEVLGWLTEAVSGRPLVAALHAVVAATGLTGDVYVTTDRDGTPSLSGGVCMTARDLALYFQLFAHDMQGSDGRAVGSAAFLAAARRGGVPRPPPLDHVRYSNHLNVRDTLVSHAGWGGQYAMADAATGISACALSVLETPFATDPDYMRCLAAALETIVRGAWIGGRA